MRGLSLLVLLFYASLSHAQITVSYALGVVKIESHGATGVPIYSVTGKTYILGCGHMYDSQKMLRAKLKISGPKQPYANKSLAWPKLVALDRNADLSLIVINRGPFYTIPVASTAQNTRQVWSIGYDRMRWPPTAKKTVIVGSQGNTTFTLDRPWHGRSGGALVCARSGTLVGIVQGYETKGPRRGVHVGHSTIVRFLTRHAPHLLPRGSAVGSQKIGYQC